MRVDNLDNIREKVIQERKQNPRWTLQQIADKCKVSKQRIHYILKSEDLPTKIFNRSWGKSRYKNCHFCKSLMPRGTGMNYCNNICRENNIYMNVGCNFCGKNKKLLKSKTMRKIKHLKQYHFFCNRQCYGKFRSVNK